MVKIDNSSKIAAANCIYSLNVLKMCIYFICSFDRYGLIYYSQKIIYYGYIVTPSMH